MNLDKLSGVNCTFVNCATFSPEAEPIEVLTFLERNEGEFIHDHTREKHPDSVGAAKKDLDACESWFTLSFRQSALQPEVYDYVHAAKHGYDALSRPGAGSLSYIPKTRTVDVHQNIDFPDALQVKATKMERVGIGMLQFIYHFAPLLRPSYACVAPVIDPQFDPNPAVAFRETGAVSFLCWANYFGPEIVAQVGEEFLRNAPCWQRVQLPCGGFLCVVTQSFLDWHFGKHRAHVQYFRQKFPDIDEL